MPQHPSYCLVDPDGIEPPSGRLQLPANPSQLEIQKTGGMINDLCSYYRDGQASTSLTIFGAGFGT